MSRPPIQPGVAPRLVFCVLDADSEPVTDFEAADISAASYNLFVGDVRTAGSAITVGSDVADTASHSTGQIVTIRAADGLYAIDAPTGAANSSYDSVEPSITASDGTQQIFPARHVIDVAVSTRSDFDVAEDDVSVGSIAENAIDADSIAADAGAEIAALVESYIVDEGDATAVLQAVADKIAADWVEGDASPLAIVAAIKADGTISTALGNMDAAVSDTATASALSDVEGKIDDVLEDTGTTLPGTISMIEGKVDVVDANVDTILSRVTSTVATLWTDMIAMITGSGVDPKFTETALENAPAGEGGGGGEGGTYIQNSTTTRIPN